MRMNRRMWEDMIEVVVAGGEGRCFVKGAMCPSTSSAEEVTWMAQQILTAPELGHEIRARLAASLLRGWVTHRDEGSADVDVLAWHRMLGGVSVQMGRAA